MAVQTVVIAVESKGKGDIIDLTKKVAAAVAKSGISEGIVNVFVAGSTASVTTIEHEPGLLKDVPRSLEKIAPYGPNYAHHETWHDDNGAAHVRATIMGPGTVVPFKGGELILGTWQQIAVVDHDTHGRKREIVLTIIGE